MNVVCYSVTFVHCVSIALSKEQQFEVMPNG
jgi:hypothetical protein